MHIYVHRYDAHSDTNESPAANVALARTGGPRFGLIVSKAVGHAVIRHRVARRLRHMCAQVTDELTPETDVVIRALPGAADATSEELLRQLRAAVRKAHAGSAGRT
ncbi:hypothetical protein GCM10023318_11930 [Nocardia callitridis]|uniref:Ribonuclease P protein component n=1 Tax=Nocardia callitridis TaxID=648753 RepID=A0ABP9JY62_9NOCA